MTNTGIIKTGSNALVLTYSGNDYNGGTLLQQGLLRLDHANAAGSGAITQSNAASTLQINATGTVANAMSLYNIATLQTVTLSGSKTLNGTTYNVAAGTTTTESGVLSGAGGLTKSGTGTMTLSASNSFSGTTTVSAGVLSLANTNALSASTLDYSSAGRVSFSNLTGANLGGLQGSTNLALTNASGGAVALNVGGNNSNTTYSGILSGGGSLTKVGAGTMILSGANTYSGTTTISAGTVAISNGASFGSNTVTFASNGTTVAALASVLVTNNYALTGSGTMDVGANILTNSGVISGAGGLTKAGAGTMVLGAANTFTGIVTNNAGAIRVGDDSGLGTTNSGTLIVSGSALELTTNNVGGNLSIGAESLSLAGTGISSGGALRNITGSNTYGGLITLTNSTRINADAGTLLLTNTGTITGATFGLTFGGAGNITVASIIGTTTGTLTKDGAGTLTLSASNSYTGGTTINAGTVAISNGSSFGSNTVTFASNGTTVAALASVRVTNDYALTGNGTMDVGANILTNSGVIAGAGSLTKAGAGTMVLGAANTYTGGTTINAGTVAISNGASFGSNTVTFASNGTTVAALASVQVTNNYALTGNGTMDVGANILTNSGVISGAGRLTKAGAGTMVLGAANTYTGGTTINEGTVAISNGSAFGSFLIGSYKVTFASNGATVAALASVQVNNNWSLIGNGTMDVGANIILTNSGEIEGGPGRLTKSGAGTLILTAENYARTMTINEGTLQIGNGGTTGSLNWSLDPSMVNNASLIFNRSGSLTQMIAISGPGSLTKAGAGTLILSGTNTYTGGTTVNGGTLGLSGANTLADAGTVTVTGAGSVLTNNFSSDFNVGNSGSGGQLVVSNGGTVRTLGAAIGRNSTASNNKATVTGSNSLWINYYNLYVGSSGSGNSLVISNGGTVSDEGTAGQVFIGANGSSSNNSVLVTGAGSLWTNRSELYVGGSGSGNSLVISNGGTVAVSSGYIGSSPNNSALVTGAGSLWTNSSTLTVRGGTLTVSDGGSLAASAISIAANAGSSGTLNIGRFGTTDTAGTINAPTIAFGSGTGAINFNQSNATTITAAISGNGAVKQLGAGTTTLSASNTYTGDTTISAGTLRFSGENAAGGSRILQTTLASLVEFLGGGRMTNQMTVFQYSFANSFEAAGQVTLADAASSIAVTSGATVTGSGSFVGTGGLTKKGAGTLSLTAGNSFSGPLNVQVGTLALAASGSSAAGSVTSLGVTNGATLLVSQSNQVNNSASVTLSGGTITRGSGVSEVFGNLNLTQASFLDFGSGTAGNFSFGTYTPSSLLTINNFAPGNTLVFGSDLRSSITNSSLFSFTNGGIGSSSWDEGTSTFTITAIPEPSTYLAAFGLLALMLWPLHRLFFCAPRSIGAAERKVG